MRACIRRGAQQIGGTCVELESQGKRIVLDLGLPLDEEADPRLLPAVSGLVSPDESLLAVFIYLPLRLARRRRHRLSRWGGASSASSQATSLAVIRSVPAGR